MSNGLYNPASDGFPAKAWECLRRNDEFIKECRSIRGTPHPDAEYGCTVCVSDQFEHPFHKVVFDLMFDRGVYDTAGKRQTLSISQSWNAIPQAIRAELAAAFDREKPGHLALPTGLPTPAVSLFHRPGSKISDPNGSLTALLRTLDFAGINTTHQLIAVPNIIWDPAHNREVCRQVGELLNKPLAPVKWLKPTGRTLGTANEWESYLLCEEWLKQGDYVLDRACAFVARERYDGENFGTTRAEREKHAKELTAAGPFKEPKYKSKIAAEVGRINSAIKSVFPRFAPI